ncbi:hypothetical protein [Thermocrispum municipale]|uniref:hypothetical protein n=1 Tax=Thermocrispum municipale TaxID=37926 RepID=UPI0004159A1E|nr:hypothetical protein [Thermocrispum municipale]
MSNKWRYEQAASFFRNLRAASHTGQHEQFQLKPDERVHFGALILSEAYTPATAEQLYRAIQDFPFLHTDDKADLITQIARDRQRLLGRERKPFAKVHRTGSRNDVPNTLDFQATDTLPSPVDYVEIDVHTPCPDLTILTATFVINGSAGDLTELLQSKSLATEEEPQPVAERPSGRVRKLMAWAKRRKHDGDAQPALLEHKRLRCMERVKQIEHACEEWFTARLPGKFSSGDAVPRPVGRGYVTKGRKPFAEDYPPLGVLDIYRSRGAWRSRRRDEEGNSPWFFSIEQSRFSDQKEVLLFAASIDDVAPPGAKSENLSSAISDKVVDRFGPLFSWLTVVRLLESYAAEVGSFRERAVRSRRPIATAKALDRYIMRDGVDVTSVCRHLERLAIDPPRSFSQLESTSVAVNRGRATGGNEGTDSPASVAESIRQQIRILSRHVIDDGEHQRIVTTSRSRVEFATSAHSVRADHHRHYGRRAQSVPEHFVTTAPTPAHAAPRPCRRANGGDRIRCTR